MAINFFLLIWLTISCVLYKVVRAISWQLGFIFVNYSGSCQDWRCSLSPIFRNEILLLLFRKIWICFYFATQKRLVSKNRIKINFLKEFGNKNDVRCVNCAIKTILCSLASQYKCLPSKSTKFCIHNNERHFSEQSKIALDLHFKLPS